MLDEIAEQMNADVSDFHKYDEKPGNRLLSRRVGNHTNSYEEIIAQFQFDYIRKKAESGESFVVYASDSDKSKCSITLCILCSLSPVINTDIRQS